MSSSARPDARPGLLLVLCLAALLLYPSTASSAGVPSADPDAPVLEALDRFMESLNNADWPAMSELFADDATVFYPLAGTPLRATGREEFAPVFNGFMERVRAGGGDPPYMSLRPEDVHVQMLGDATVVSFQIKNPAVCSRRTLVLEQRRERWMIVHLHASNIRLDTD